MKGIEFCHALGFMHRNIKPKHILLKGIDAKRSRYTTLGDLERLMKGDFVKISDFGFCRNLCIPSRTYTAVVGSIPYKAPELLQPFLTDETLQYNEKIDIWALGCVFGEMLHGEKLFEDESEIDVYRKQDFLQMLAAKSRYSCGSNLKQSKHMRLTYVHQLLCGLLEVIPAGRWDASEALRSPVFISQHEKKSHVGFFTPESAVTDTPEEHLNPLLMPALDETEILNLADHCWHLIKLKLRATHFFTFEQTLEAAKHRKEIESMLEPFVELLVNTYGFQAFGESIPTWGKNPSILLNTIHKHRAST